MLILVLLGMYFDAVVKFGTSQTLLIRLALAILCNKLIFCCRNYSKRKLCAEIRYFTLEIWPPWGI